MGNYPDGMTQQDHDREFDREPDDEPEKFFWYAFSDVTVNIRAKSKAAAIEILNSARGMSEGSPIDIWTDIDKDKIEESEE